MPQACPKGNVRGNGARVCEGKAKRSPSRIVPRDAEANLWLNENFLLPRVRTVFVNSAGIHLMRPVEMEGTIRINSVISRLCEKSVFCIVILYFLFCNFNKTSRKIVSTV